ncbi:MAG: AraC family transcriptional regulator [Chryseobacterium sp.]|nr:MAG: AraC family transcriptional regulator [Chryseobacterium sp.]
MRPYFESVTRASEKSFVVRKFNEQKFSAPYHYHPEFELTYILEGSGTRFIGNMMQDYEPGDLVLIGPNLPHCWKTVDNAETRSVSIVVHFMEDFMGTEFLSRPELNRIRLLLQKSSAGIIFSNSKEKFRTELIQLYKETDNFLQLLLLLKLLNKLSNSKYRIADHEHNFTSLPDTDKERINKITAYIVANFQESISLPVIAKQVNLTPQAFCRYFKKMTRKTFVEAVNDYRIDFAVKLLIQSEKPVSEISYGCGFNDIPHFSKMFRRKKGLSPLQYRKNFTGIKSSV